MAPLLTLCRNVHRAYNLVREHNFSLSGLVGTDVHDKTMGIIGAGKIGKFTAQIFRGFGAKVLAYDPFQDDAWAEENGVDFCELDVLLANSNFVSLHMPLTQETLHLLNEETIGRMNPGAFLINTSSGKLIDTKALIGALKTDHLSGVGLDIYEEEEGIFFEDRSG